MSIENRTVPNATISNGFLTAQLLLPDADKGYYRGTRFDWSGVIQSLRFGKQEYFGRWFDDYNPLHHDCIVGPVDAFLPVGYEEAGPGGRFLMMGVGILEKSDERPWEFVRTYPLVNGGQWQAECQADQVRMTQVLCDTTWAYRYEKVVALVPGKPVMRIFHSLCNEGRQTLQTLSYNHNFFVIDNWPVGIGYAAEFPRPITGRIEVGAERVEIDGRRLTLKRKFQASESIFCVGIGGQDPAMPGYEMRVEHTLAGGTVRITCDQPAVRVDLWANPRTFCPEPYVEVKAEPGLSAEWVITYEFGECGR